MFALAGAGRETFAEPVPARSGEQASTLRAGPPITLSRLTSTFTLFSAPGQTVTRVGVATLRVKTANAGGYTVTVKVNADSLAPPTSGSQDRIPVGNLMVRETGTTTFHPLSRTSAVTAHSRPAGRRPRAIGSAPTTGSTCRPCTPTATAWS